MFEIPLNKRKVKNLFNKVKIKKEKETRNVTA